MVSLTTTYQQPLWQQFVNKTLTNDQGYNFSFKLLDGQLIARVSRDNIFWQGMKVIVLKNFVTKGDILPRDLTFDSTKRCAVIGKRGLFGRGCTNSRVIELSVSQMELASPLPQVYVGAEASFATQAGQVIQCLTDGQIKEVDSPSTATHFFLFITDSFLKSKERLLPPPLFPGKLGAVT